MLQGKGLISFLAGGIAGLVGNPGGAHEVSPRACPEQNANFTWHTNVEIIMVRMQGDFAKPPEKRLNYKNCLDGLYRVRSRTSL